MISIFTKCLGSFSLRLTDTKYQRLNARNVERVKLESVYDRVNPLLLTYSRFLFSILGDIFILMHLFSIIHIGRFMEQKTKNPQYHILA